MTHCLPCAIYLKALCHISRVCYWKTISLLFRLCELGPCPCSMKCIEPNLYIVNTNMVYWCIYRSYCSLHIHKDLTYPYDQSKLFMNFFFLTNIYRFKTSLSEVKSVAFSQKMKILSFCCYFWIVIPFIN